MALKIVLRSRKGKVRVYRRRWIKFGAAGLLGALFLLLLISRLSLLKGAGDNQISRRSLASQKVEDFFRRYWHTPVPLQGPPPASFSGREASLSPEACAGCHPRQYADWKESLHSRAMGPGPWGQIIDLTQKSPEEAVLCMACHAPLSEQMPLLTKETGSSEEKYAGNKFYDPQLQLRGITCAACHLRGNRRFGPPRIDGDPANTYPSGMPDHGGFQATPYFEKAEFCQGCHQFDPKTSLLVNGKPLEDTYREWKNSMWGQGGAACQDCHMPARRHLWRGIHDREWVKGGVRVEAHLKTAAPNADSPVELSVRVTNAAVGHKFPTYITPQVFVRAALLDRKGNVLPGTRQERIIGRDARFEGGEWKEYFDTRIPPGGQSLETFRWTSPARAKKVRTWIEVDPDHFYRVNFYPAFLRDQEPASQARKLIEKALLTAGRTAYILFDRTLPLPDR